MPMYPTVHRNPARSDEEARAIILDIALRAKGKWAPDLEFEPGELDVIRDLVLEHGPEVANIPEVLLYTQLKVKRFQDKLVRGATVERPGAYDEMRAKLLRAPADVFETLIRSGIQWLRIEYEEQERYQAHAKEQGRDWGPDGERAFEMETRVRDALMEADDEIAGLLAKKPMSVRSAYAPDARRAGFGPRWTTRDWRRVLVYSEDLSGDPYSNDDVMKAFDTASRELGEDWGWGSINAAVQEFALDVPVDAPFVLDEEHRRMRGRRRRIPRINPSDDTKRAAVGKYKEFWRLEPTKIGDFPSSFKIPTQAHKLGAGVHVLYESGKVDPETMKKPKKPLSYIHEHDSGVHVYDLQGTKDTEVPEFICKAPALVKLGACLGFAWKGDDGEAEAEATAPLPDLYCTVDGRALLVIQSRRFVLAIIWGGSLGVEARGIVG